MRSLFFLYLLFVTSSYCLGQKSTFSIKRSYKVNGYIIIDKDTIEGYIAIPIDGDEVDYSSLTKEIVFVDSMDKSKKYKPGTLLGFGIEKDDVISHYIRVPKPGNSLKSIFLKKVVEGEAMLLVEKIDRAAGYTTMHNYGMGASSSYYQKNFNLNVYYLKIGDGEIIKIPFDRKNASISIKELKKLLVYLPDSFTTSNEHVDISSFIKLLEDYNTRSNKKN